MRSTPFALIVLAVLGSAAGCTSDGSPEAARSPAAAAAVSVWQEFVACARTNGQSNWPDPVVDANTGKATFPAAAGFEEKMAFEAVRTQCASILDKLPPQANPLAVLPITPERLKALREYAQCLRENGLPETTDPQPDGLWPDPPEPPGGWPADLGQRRAAAFAVCDPKFESRLQQ